MSLYFEQQNQETVTRRIPRTSVLDGDSGIEGLYVNAVTSLSKWQFSAQEFQPPAPRFDQRYAGILRADAADQDDLGPLLIPFKEGWAIQPIQPPVPWRVSAKSGNAGAAIARGDDGNAGIFVPPWVMASPATTFPDKQNLVAGAIPSYNAGPVVGAIKSMPNIIAPTVLKAAPGTLIAVSVVVAGSTQGGFYDTASNNPSQANQVSVIPNQAGIPLFFDWPCQQGILIVPGAGQVLAAKWT